MKITRFFESLSGGMIIALAILLVFLIGLADYHAGPELSSSIFYVVPLAISACYGSRKSAILIAIPAAAVWLARASLSGQTYSRPFMIYWNGSVRPGLVLIIGVLLSGYRAKLTVEETLADIDLDNFKPVNDAMGKLRGNLLDAMKQEGWPVLSVSAWLPVRGRLGTSRR